MSSRVIGPALVGLALAVSPARAQPTGDGSALVRALGECRRLSDINARVTCYDAATAQLETAERSGEVVLIDRAQARAARRQAFGFNLPSLAVLNLGRGDEDPDRLNVVLERARRDADGRWVLHTSEGQVWRQIDSRSVLNEPQRGSKAEIRTAALGSFFMNIDGQRAIRVRREQ